MQLSRTYATAALAALSLGLYGCGGADAPSVPVVRTPVAIVVNTSPSASAAAGTSAGSFAVKVIDFSGLPVSGVSVAFSVTGAVSAAPATATTDASGVATTQVTAGTISGVASVTATVSGIAPSSTPLQVTPGPATRIAVTPKTVRLVFVGDSARVTAAGQDQYGNATQAGAITYSVVDATLLSVDASGLVRVLRQGGTTGVVAVSAAKADTSVVTVLPVGSTYCTGLVATTTMAVGDVQTFSGVQYGCLGGTASGAEFVITTFNSATDQINSLSASVIGNGLATPPSTSLLPPTTTSASRIPITASATSGPTLDRDFHLKLLEQARERARAAGARASGSSQLSASRLNSSTGISRAVGAIPATVNVGDILTVNVSANGCSTPLNHGLRVAAVGTKSIVLADTLNPSGGFADADYQRFAARFDTLIYPMDVGAFGAPSDIDGNGRVAIIFTLSVNQLTPSGSSSYVGGFFNPRDLFARVDPVNGNCPGSNVGEMFWLIPSRPAPSRTSSSTSSMPGADCTSTTPLLALRAKTSGSTKD
jgi:hypothetical protein